MCTELHVMWVGRGDETRKLGVVGECRRVRMRLRVVLLGMMRREGMRL